MFFKNLCFVVGLLLLLVASVRAGNKTTEKLTTRCRENERRALLEFKAGVVDNYGILSSWGNNSNNEEECCNWRGIRCSNRTGHVILVNLPGNRDIDSYSLLTGKISPSLSELKHLKHLNLSQNGFSGVIPHQLGNLVNLRYLHLGESRFIGEIPPQLGNLTNLRFLDLGYKSYFNRVIVQNLEWVSRFHLLTHLDLSGVNLSSCNGWLNQIYKLSSLTHLHLSMCSLPDQFGSLMNTSFPAFNSLVVADFSDNNFISPKSYNWLFNFTTTLVYLDLSHTSFPRSEIPEAIGSITSLESLILYRCEVEGKLPDYFRNLSRLATLDLGQNQLHDSLPDYLTRFPYLREMKIPDNKLNGSFPNNFSHLSSSLVHLDLSKNQLTGLLPNLTLFSSLETLALNDNNLEGTVPEAYLSNLFKLTYLGLSSNSLSFRSSVDWFPPFKLDIILLRNCNMGPHFPNWIRSQRNFSIIDISHNGISDTIPHWFWDLSPSLRNLDMSNNQIKGILPNISLTFQDIDYIDLSYNLLQGCIPPLPLLMFFLDLAHNMFTGSLSFICTGLVRLYYLDLSDNKLLGELSSDCFMRSISILNLANNDFYGNIPTSIGAQDQLISLRLRNNSLTGHIPLSLMNNTALLLLDLSENKLSGEVPTWIGTTLTSLIVLSLRMNKIYGSIPLQICQLRNARVLDMSRNNLTGSIPHCISNFTSLVEKVDDGLPFGFSIGDEYGNSGVLYPNALVQWKRVASEYNTTLQYLKLIDLSGNGLVGEIPEEFSTLKELISLNLSSNRLTGNIIQKIGQMKNLESLDLSRNHLSGKIPSGLASLTLLSVLDVSNNNLSGIIPSSTQLQSFKPSDFAGNERLCGPPLSNNCGVVISLSAGHDDAKSSKFWLYVSVVLGFGTGFWGFLGPLLLQRTWRHAYYNWLGNTGDWICVTVILYMTRLQRKVYC